MLETLAKRAANHAANTSCVVGGAMHISRLGSQIVILSTKKSY